MNFPGLITWQDVLQRLLVIFPEGTPGRSFLTKDMTAKTVFVALYIGAVEGEDRWLAPRLVVRMTNIWAAKWKDAEREAYFLQMNAPRAVVGPDRWYADNTREPIRDEVIRQGLVAVNAMIERSGVATTSPAGRYAVTADFAALFGPGLTDPQVEAAADAWRKKYLSAAALARAALVRSSATTASANIAVQCPNGPSFILPPGPSPTITKAVVEVFAPRFLGDPRVAWVSDSGTKEVFRNAPLEKSLRIKLDAASMLPDVVLVDLNPPGRPNAVLIVFVEVVASDGPVTEQRRNALLKLALQFRWRGAELAAEGAGEGRGVREAELRRDVLDLAMAGAGEHAVRAEEAFAHDGARDPAMGFEEPVERGARDPGQLGEPIGTERPGPEMLGDQRPDLRQPGVVHRRRRVAT